MTQKVASDHWQYRIEPYRQNPGEASWSPVPEDQAEIWFGFRAKGDDSRCFGVFPSRADAEKAMAILKEHDQQPETTRFQQILKGDNPPDKKTQEQAMQKDRGRET